MKTNNNEIKNFFNRKANDYDKKHIKLIDGGIKGKKIVAEYVPVTASKILDLGAGTGLELEFILKKFPKAKIVCVDFSSEMLEQLKIKYKNFDVETIECDYFDYTFKKNEFDCIISVMSFHHFKKNKKLKLYRKIFKSLKPAGVFINCDFIVSSLAEEKEYLKKSKKDRTNKDFGHDIPCSIQTENKILSKAGFKYIRNPWSESNTLLMVATK